MAIYSSWLVGSFQLVNDATITVNASDVVVSAGSYYLRDATDSLSLIKQVETAIASVVAGSTVYIGQDRKVRIDFDGNATNITIPSTLRAVLGFTQAGYGPVSLLVAERVSTLLWSPSWPETTEGSPVGVPGHKVYDRVMTSSPTGLTTNVTIHYSTTRVKLRWFAVPSDRAWTTDELPGEFNQFFNDIIVYGRNMKLYSQMLEDEASGAAVSWTAGLGPYVDPDPDFAWYKRFVSNSDSLGANIEIDLQVTGELA